MCERSYSAGGMFTHRCYPGGMIDITWTLPARRGVKRGSAQVASLDDAERAFRQAVFEAAGASLVEGHGLLCHAFGRDLAAYAELSMIIDGVWRWENHGYTVVLRAAQP